MSWPSMRRTRHRDAGTIETERRQFTLRTDSRLRDPEEFRKLVVATRGGYPIRLDEVADVEVGVEDDSVIARADGRNAVSLGVIRQSRARLSPRMRTAMPMPLSWCAG